MRDQQLAKTEGLGKLESSKAPSREEFSVLLVNRIKDGRTIAWELRLYITLQAPKSLYCRLAACPFMHSFRS